MPPPRHALPPLPLIALVAACGCGGMEVGSEDPGVEQVGDDEADDDPSDPSDDDAVSEEVGPALADPLFDPPGGGFVGTVTVTITSSAGVGDVLFCMAPPGEVCDLQPYVGPVVIDHSTILHARVDVTAEPGERHARSFVALDETVAETTSNLPLMVFWTDGMAPAGILTVPMGLNVIEPDASGRAAMAGHPADSGRCRLKIRGSSTAGMPKSSYDLELWKAGSEEDRTAPLGGMPEDGDWVLYAPYVYDEALIRNTLGYELSRAIGRYAPRTRFVELYLATNGDPVTTWNYRGVYGLTEEIERGPDRVDIARLEPDDVAEPEISGGYVFKRDRVGMGESGFWAGDAGGAFSFADPLVAVDPEEAELAPEQADYLAGVADDLALALVQEDFTHPFTGEHYTEIIDVDSFIDHHILNVLVKNPDAFRLSAYMVKDREGPVVAGPLWDLDRTAGANDSRAIDPTHWDATNETSDTTDVFGYGWYGRMFDDPEFRDRYWARWSELLDGALSIDHILALVEELAEELEEAGERNAQRWGAAPFPLEIDALETWLQQRHAWISGCIAAHDDPRECAG